MQPTTVRHWSTWEHIPLNYKYQFNGLIFQSKQLHTFLSYLIINIWYDVSPAIEFINLYNDV